MKMYSPNIVKPRGDRGRRLDADPFISRSFGLGSTRRLHEPEYASLPYRKGTLCSSYQRNHANRYVDEVMDYEADESMFLYTIYESDEEDEENEELAPSFSRCASPSLKLHLDLSTLNRTQFLCPNYSSSVDSTSSTLLSDSILPSPYLEYMEYISPISTPGSFTTMIKEKKGYIFDASGANEPQDYFPTYLAGSNFDDDINRSGPIQVPRSNSSDKSSIMAEVERINSNDSGVQLHSPKKQTHLRTLFIPRNR